CVRRLAPLNLLGLAVATVLLWRWSLRQEQKPPSKEEPAAIEQPTQINPFKAAVPLVPLVLLYLTAPPLKLIEVEAWLLVDPNVPGAPGLFDSRLTGAAMLFGAAVAALATPSKAGQVAASFFEGAGYGFAHIVSLIVIATCFGKGIEVVGLANELGE